VGRDCGEGEPMSETTRLTGNDAQDFMERRAILQALKDADSKGKLGIVAMMYGVDKERLKAIMNGADMDNWETSVLSSGLNEP
jgi:hypothetical protein